MALQPTNNRGLGSEKIVVNEQSETNIKFSDKHPKMTQTIKIVAAACLASLATATLMALASPPVFFAILIPTALVGGGIVAVTGLDYTISRVVNQYFSYKEKKDQDYQEDFKLFVEGSMDATI